MNKIAAILGLLAGTSLLLYWGGEAPAWLLKLECVAVMAAALLFGFTAYSPSAPDWLRHDAVRGVALVYLGVGAAVVPANLLLSALLIGTGCKLVTRSAVQVTVRVTSGMLASGSTDLVVKPEGGVSRR